MKLAKEGFYDGTLFHRVIKDLMIQGGDPDSKDRLFHKRGALAAARQGDEVKPERPSSGSQF